MEVIEVSASEDYTTNLSTESRSHQVRIETVKKHLLEHGERRERCIKQCTKKASLISQEAVDKKLFHVKLTEAGGAHDASFLRHFA